MTAPPETTSRLRLGVVAALTAGLLAALALSGRLLGQPGLTALGFDHAPMKANAAVAIIVAVIAWLLVHSADRTLRRAGVVLAGVVGIFAALTLLQHLAGVDLGIDQALLRDPAALDGMPGRTSVGVCVALACAATAIGLTVRRDSFSENARQIARLIGLGVALFAIALHLSEPETLRVVSGFQTFGLVGAVALALLFVAIGMDHRAASLRWQVAHLGVVVIAPLAALTVHFASAERDIAVQLAGTRLAALAQLGVERQDEIIEQSRRTLLYLARDPSVRSRDARCPSVLHSFANLNASTRTLFVIDREGVARCANSPALIGLSLGDRDYVKEAYATQSFTVSDMFVSRTTGVPRIAAALPLLLPGGDRVIIAASIDLAALGDPLEKLADRFDDRATMTLIDGGGVVLARYPRDAGLIGADIGEATFVTSALASPGSFFTAAEMDGRETVFAAQRQAFGGGALIVGLPKRDVIGPVDARMNNRLLLICALLAASVAVGTLGGEALVLRPLRALIDYAGKLQAGEFGARPAVEAQGEVGALGRALHTMARAVDDRERRLAGAEALFRGLFDHSPDASAVVGVGSDGRFRIETWNAAAQLATGLTTAEAVGRDPRDVFPGPRGEQVERDFAQTLKLGRVMKVERETSMNGQLTTYEIVLAPLRDAEGRIARLFVAARDISDRKRVERLKNEFVSTVSHELRTPLTSIAGSLGLLAGGAAGALGERADHLIAIAHSNSLRLVRLINDILDIEKIESGRMVFDLKPVAMRDLVVQAIGGLKAYADEFGVAVELEGGSDDVTVRGDADRLTQVVTNLISNAIKFSPRNGVVTVRAFEEDQAAVIAVRDRGAGIPESFRPRMFTKFAQADGSDSRRKGGTGLGLAIVREIVDRHAGAVTYETAIGEGTEFQVRLPRLHQGDDAPSPFALSARPNVLICEDDPFIATILSELLNDAGFDSATAGTIRAAREAAIGGGIDAILVDLYLPDGDGISLIRDLQATPATRAIPIIVVSAAAERGKADARAAMLDVVAWLDKPIDSKRLASVLQERLGARRDRPRVLHVEDDADLRNVVSAAISSIADVVSVAGLQGAHEALADGSFDLAIVDVTLDDGSGLDLLVTLERRPRPIPIVIFSAHDIDRDVAAKVEAALTKSRTSLGTLVDTVRRVVGDPA